MATCLSLLVVCSTDKVKLIVTFCSHTCSLRVSRILPKVKGILNLVLISKSNKLRYHKTSAEKEGQDDTFVTKEEFGICVIPTLPREPQGSHKIPTSSSYTQRFNTYM
jgi:hypothetical protein